MTWEVFTGRRARFLDARLSIMGSGLVRINPAAYRLLGSPEAVHFLTAIDDEGGLRVRVRTANLDDDHAYRCGRSDNAAVVGGSRGFVDAFHLKRGIQYLVALVEPGTIEARAALELEEPAA